MRLVVAVVCLTLATGCATFGPDDVDPDPSAPVQTSALRYRLVDNGVGDYELTIPWTYRSERPSTLYYDRCTSTLEKKVNEVWLRAYFLICPLSDSAVDSIPAGSLFTSAFFVYACYEANCAPRMEIEPIPGVYRLVIGLYASAVLQGGVTLLRDSPPLDDRRSNAFWLDLP
jgi:hypothetical protein